MLASPKLLFALLLVLGSTRADAAVTATGPELLWQPAMHARPDISTLGRVEMRTVLDIDTVAGSPP